MLAPSCTAPAVTRAPARLQRSHSRLDVLYLQPLLETALPSAPDISCLPAHRLLPEQHPRVLGLSTASPCPCLRLRTLYVHDPESLLASKSSELVTFGAAATSLFRHMGSKRLTFGREAQGPVLHLCTSYLPVAAFKNTVCN